MQLHKFELVVAIHVSPREGVRLDDAASTLGILCHGLCLHHSPLIALTLQDSLLTLILLDFGDLCANLITVRVLLVAAVAF